MDDPLLVGVEVWYVAQCPLRDLGDVRGEDAANTLVIVAEVGDAQASTVSTVPSASIMVGALHFLLGAQFLPIYFQ